MEYTARRPIQPVSDYIGVCVLSNLLVSCSAPLPSSLWAHVSGLLVVCWWSSVHGLFGVFMCALAKFAC